MFMENTYLWNCNFTIVLEHKRFTADFIGSTVGSASLFTSRGTGDLARCTGDLARDDRSIAFTSADGWWRAWCCDYKQNKIYKL